MTCYDELRHKQDGSEPYDPNSWPRVQQDGNRVDEIAANPSCFIGHVRPMRHVGVYSQWKDGQREE